MDVCEDSHNSKCARYYDIEQDGLAQDWSREVVWCNPPFGRIEPWVKKAYESSLQRAIVVMLLPCRTDTQWWHDYIHYVESRWIRGRIKFDGTDDRAPFATVIFIFRAPKPRSRGGLPRRIQ